LPPLLLRHAPGVAQLDVVTRTVLDVAAAAVVNHHCGRPVSASWPTRCRCAAADPVLVGVALVSASSPRFTAEEASLPAAQRAAPRRRPATSRGYAFQVVRQRVVPKSLPGRSRSRALGTSADSEAPGAQRQLPRCEGALVGVDASRSWRGAPRRRRSCRRLSPPCGHRVPSRWPPRRQPPGCRRSCCRCCGPPPAPQLRHAPSVVRSLQRSVVVKSPW
jgi:hypothetical protein